MRSSSLFPLVIAAAGAIACSRADAPSTRPAAAPESAPVRVTMVTDQADAALAYAASVRSGRPDESAWNRLVASEGYRRLHRREASMGRAFTDTTFRSFLHADTLLVRVPDISRTLAEWRQADFTGAAERAFGYLPSGARLDAVLYPMVKPRDNSFVFDLATDSAAIFLYVDPTVTRSQLENTIAHELHHIGIAAACVGVEAGEGLADNVRPAVRWMGAFAEGIAMLAAAGGPDVHPHAASSGEQRTRWNADYAKAAADMVELERFFTDVIAGELSDEEQRSRAAPFWGEAQGPWYTIGYLMAVTVERVDGRKALIPGLCEPHRLLLAYERAAVRSGDSTLPRWSPRLMEHLITGVAEQ